METIIEVGKNKKYLNLPFFYNNTKDKEKWEGWRLHLKLKFRQSTILYIYEQDKINYIKDHYKNTTFEVIKAKVHLISTNIHFFSSEIIQNLENIFDELDIIAKLDALLYNPKFGMAITNLKKTFDKIFTKFTLAIMPLDFTNQHKNIQFLKNFQ